jgi:hypothetical protein
MLQGPVWRVEVRSVRRGLESGLLNGVTITWDIATICNYQPHPSFATASSIRGTYSARRTGGPGSASVHRPAPPSRRPPHPLWSATSPKARSARRRTPPDPLRRRAGPCRRPAATRPPPTAARCRHRCPEPTGGGPLGTSSKCDWRFVDRDRHDTSQPNKAANPHSQCRG